MSEDIIQEAFQFINKLHGPPYSFNLARPLNWEDRPSPFFSIEDQVRIELPLFPSLKSVQGDLSLLCSLDKLSLFLLASYGCHKNHISFQKLLAENNSLFSSREVSGIFASRVLASGGGAYPADIYLVFGKTWNAFINNMANFVFRYSANYHALILYKDISEELKKLDPFQAPEEGISLFVSVNFLRTFFKYQSFAYRLSAVDIGVVLGRLCYLTSFFYPNSLFSFDFETSQWEAIFNIDSQNEPLYVTVTLLETFRGHDKKIKVNYELEQPKKRTRSFETKALPKELRVLHELAHHWKTQTPSVHRINKSQLTGQISKEKSPDMPTLFQAITNRSSLAYAYTGESVQSFIVMDVLWEIQKQVDLLNQLNVGLPLPPVELYCALLNVSSYTPGLYHYEAKQQALRLLQPKLFNMELNACLYLQNVNIELSAFCIHLVGRLSWQGDPRGPKEYRVLNMIIGALIDRITISASLAGLSAHPYLGFDGKKVARLYQNIPEPQCVLAQIAVGKTGNTNRIDVSHIL